MEKQVSIYDLMTEQQEEVKIPVASSGEKTYTIPDDVWKTRCQYCVHKCGKENHPVPFAVVHKHQYRHLLPCRILSIAFMDKMPGECLSFAPLDVYGICETCKYNNMFHEGFCLKKDHAEQRRVFYGQAYNNNQDYWGRHRLSVCDDYEPAREGLLRMEEIHGMEQVDKKDDAARGCSDPAVAGLRA